MYLTYLLPPRGAVVPPASSRHAPARRRLLGDPLLEREPGHSNRPAKPDARQDPRRQQLVRLVAPESQNLGHFGRRQQHFVHVRHLPSR